MATFVIYPDPVLSVRAMPRPLNSHLSAIGDRLLAAAREVQAYGLAAAHIGNTEPVVVISVSPQTSQRDYRILFNPVLLSLSESTTIGSEGSVSLPGIEVDIPRADWVDVAYANEHGEPITLRLHDFAARVAQHEIDQMNGVFFLSRISRLKRETALRRFRKRQ